METLAPLPAGFANTRDALHRVAEELVAPARKPHNEIALVPTRGGFGTPEFEFAGARSRVRVDGTELVVEADGEERWVELESLAAGGDLLGPELLPDGVPTDPTPLAIDAEAAAALAAWFAFGAEVLAAFAAGMPDLAEPSPAILWPEHFDIAIEAGREGAGERANVGASPGDEAHDEQYLYVGPWTARPEGALWNATAFPGAELAYAELLAADDPAATAIEFFGTRARALTD
jgi:hypothetical protein